MKPNFSYNDLFVEAKSLWDNGTSFNEIESVFLKNGVDEYIVKEIIKKLADYKNNKRLILGFKLIGIGAVILIISCILTIIKGYSNAQFTFVLYGLTSLGTCFIISGFILVFG
jgi:hypothetical protein